MWPILYRHKELLFPQTTIGNSSVIVIRLHRVHVCFLCSVCIVLYGTIHCTCIIYVTNPSFPLLPSLLSSFSLSLSLSLSFPRFFSFSLPSPSFPPQIQTLKLTNPTQHPVVVQPVLLHYYQQPQKIVQILFESGSIENTDFGRSQSSFSLDPDTWGYDTSLTKHILIPGSETNEVEIRVKFLAHETQLSSSLLILRNNLTGLEYVVLRGRGLEGQFSIDGVQPDTSSLLIQYSPSDLERCTGTMYIHAHA